MMQKMLDGVSTDTIWKMDEIGFNLEHNLIKILATKGQRQVNAWVSPSHQNITVAACVDADGQAMTPLFVVKGKTSISLNGFNTSEALVNSVWTYQANARMENLGLNCYN